MKVGVVIVSYNFEPWIHKCLSSIKSGKHIVEIVVVDNGSTDKTVNIIQEEHKGVHLIEAKSNLGFGQGNNVGIKKMVDAKFDFIFLLNQDAWMELDTIDTLVEVLISNPDIGVLSPVHLNGSYTNLDSKFEVFVNASKDVDLPNINYEYFKSGSGRELIEVPFVNAAAWLIPKDVFRQIGGFDPLFFHYGEDYNFVSRVRYHGFGIYISLGTSICHDREEEDESKSYMRILNSGLARVSDIRYPFASIYIIQCVRLLAAALINLILLKFKRAQMFVKEFIQLVSKLPDIRLSRKLALTKDGPFI